MEWLTLLRWIWAAGALAVALLAALVAVRAKGALVWQKSLKKEIDSLMPPAGTADLTTRKALAIVQHRCRGLLSSFSPSIGDLQHLKNYVHEIALCYHPLAQRPELQIGVGAFLHSLEKSLQRFDAILQRRGFSRLRALNIRHIKKAWHWYCAISSSRMFRLYFRYRAVLNKMAHVRFLFYLDPFMWLAFLSNRLTVLILIKHLMVDLHLYVGKLAVEAFEDNTTTIEDKDLSREALEEVLEELEAAPDPGNGWKDPEIDAIRNRLIGFATLIKSNPGIAEWKAAVADAAEVIAGRHFPETDNPLEEAAIGPLLDRTRSWIETVSKGEEYLLARRLYQIRLETLWRAKNLSDFLLPGVLGKFVEKAYRTYGWIKWPFKVYRWARRRSPWFIALEIGWQATKKVTLAQIYGRTFDRACQELNRVYRESRKLRRKKNRNHFARPANSIEKNYP
jgi:hypothetical protein